MTERAPEMIDHRKLGRELHLFDTHELVGAGLPLWLPDGAVIRAELERFAAEQAIAAGCQHVFSPVLAKRELYERSGHWAKFSDDMFPVMNIGGEEFVLRPANCPHHVLIYAAEQRSYRDLPVRLNELGSMFRSELSGVLGGLARVRQINLDDTHVFCAEDQIVSEVAAAIAQTHAAYELLGLDVAYYRLSLSGPKGKYIGDPQLWKRAERQLAGVLDELGLPYKEAIDEAAFYGPKIDVQVLDPAGREETLSTVQLDFNLPERFDLSYIGAGGDRRRPVMIHRGLLSAMERLVAHLIEVYAGAFPVWLAPVQVIALPVGADQSQAASEFVNRLRAAGLRAEIDNSDNTLGLRIRRAIDRRAPYVAVLGEREVAAGSVAIRLRDGKQPDPRPVEDVISAIAAVAASRSRKLDLP
jgi:threonyl-tRNA synthetase